MIANIIFDELRTIPKVIGPKLYHYGDHEQIFFGYDSKYHLRMCIVISDAIYIRIDMDNRYRTAKSINFMKFVSIAESLCEVIESDFVQASFRSQLENA